MNFPGFKPYNCEFEIVSRYDKVQYGLQSSWHYRSQLTSNLAKTHILTNCSLQQIGQPTNSYVISGDLDPVESRYILVGKNSGGLSIFDASKAKNGNFFPQVGRIKGGVSGTHSCGVKCVQWYPVDAGLFTTSSSDYCIKIWDPNSMKKVDEFKLDCIANHHHMSPLASKHSLLAVAGEKGDIVLCDLRTGSSSHVLYGHEGPVHIVQWTKHDPNILASGGKDKTIRMWDVRSGKSCLRVLDSDNYSEESHKHRKRVKKIHVAHNSQVTSLCFTHDGLWLISFSLDGHLKIWDTSTGRNMMVKSGTIYTNITKTLSMSVTYNLYPDLVYIPSKSTIFVYEVVTGVLVNVLHGHLSTVLGTIFNPKTGDVYSYGKDKNFLIWRPKNLCPNDIDENKDICTNSNYSMAQAADNWSSDED